MDEEDFEQELKAVCNEFKQEHDLSEEDISEVLQMMKLRVRHKPDYLD